jgi:homoserine dehydrogenase
MSIDQALPLSSEVVKEVRTLNVGIFGCGVVGTGVCKILQSKHAEFIRRFRTDVRLKGICVQDAQKIRDSSVPRHLITSEPGALLDNGEIDLVLELIGGRYDALNVIESSLAARKHVITANKLVLSHELPRLRKLAQRRGVSLLYSASVCGSVPVLRAIDELRVGDEIRSIRGIVNGSTNFILTAMAEQDISYEAALVEARARGFLEADPSLDVSGQDAAQKLSVLIYHAFGQHVRPEAIQTSGIDTVRQEDVARAQRQGRTIKLVAQACKDLVSQRVTAMVQAVEVDRTHLFAHTRDEFNALEIETLHAGPQLLYGKGAGSLPTASSVIGDLLELLREG